MAFVAEYEALPEVVQDELLAHIAVRFAFAFDPRRTAIVLCGGDKSGGSEQRFYRQLIAKADGRFDVHITDLKAKETKKKGKHRS